LQTTRLAASFELLNSSLALTAPELCSFETSAIQLFWDKPLDLDQWFSKWSISTPRG